MNKPKRENYPNICLWENYVDYSRELERYCDDLELAYKMVLRDGEKLEKALDKACELIVNAYWGKETKKWTKEQWKEWLMKDE